MSRVNQLAEAYYQLRTRAIIFAYPVRDMQKRGWILNTNETEELEKEMLRFFRVETIEELETVSFP